MRIWPRNSFVGKPVASSDIYAMGVIAYEMVTGRRPFNPASPFQLLEMQKAGVKLNPSDLRPSLPEAAQRAILRALSYDPNERHSRARCLGDELAQALRAETNLAPASDAPSEEQPTVAASKQRSFIQRVDIRSSTSPTIRNKMKLYTALVVLLVLIAAAAIAYSKLHRGNPLTTVEFSDEFLNLNRWTAPTSGWTTNLHNQLEIENQPSIGFPTGISYGDLTMHFHLTLLNAGGAAWALRVQDHNNYYLFYLSGPEGLYPNRFITYVVRDGRFNPATFALSTPVVAALKADGQYEIDIRVERNEINHQIIPSETGEVINLGYYKDTGNFFRAGNIGFRTVGIERFWISDLFVRPPEIQLPQ